MVVEQPYPSPSPATRRLPCERPNLRWRGGAQAFRSADWGWNFNDIGRPSQSTVSHHHEEEAMAHPPSTPSPICSPFGSSTSAACSPSQQLPPHLGSASIIQNGGRLKEERSALRHSFSSRSDIGALFAAKPTRLNSQVRQATEDRPRAFSVRRANLRRNLSSDTALQLRFRELERSVRFDHDVVPSITEEISTSNKTDEDANDQRRKSKTESATSPPRFEPSTSIQIKLPETNEEGTERNKEALESAEGDGDAYRSLSSTDGDHIHGENIEKRDVENGSRKKMTTFNRTGFRFSSTGSDRENPPAQLATEKLKREKLEAKTMAWQETKTAKVLDRLKREEDIILAWENEQKVKANIHMKKVERKLEEKRAKALEKMQIKIARAHKKAEDRKAAGRAKFGAETARVSTIVDKIRCTGKLPWKFHFF